MKSYDVPNTWKGIIKIIGPGLIWATAAIGSGELIITTKVGAEYGYSFIWALWVGLWLKYWIQKGVLDLTILTGEPVINLWNKLKFGKAISVYWILFFILTLTGVSGLLGLTASALNILVPQLSVNIWAIIVVASVIVIAYFQNYSGFEKSMLILSAFTVVGVIGVVILAKPNLPEVFSWTFPNSFPVALIFLSLLGWGAGSGPDLMIPYSWWVAEKGYQNLKFNKEGDALMNLTDYDSTQKIKKWLNIAKWDTIIGYAFTGFVASAFMIAGAALLKPRGILVSGLDVLKNVAIIFTESYGGWAFSLFILSAGAALFDTGLGVFDGARVAIAHLIRLLLGKSLVPIDKIRSNNLYRMTLILCALIPLAIFLGFPNPVLLVTFASIVSAVSMPLLAMLVYWSLIKQIPSTYKPNKFYSVNLVLAAFVYLFFMIQSLVGLF